MIGLAADECGVLTGSLEARVERLPIRRPNLGKKNCAPAQLNHDLTVLFRPLRIDPQNRFNPASAIMVHTDYRCLSRCVYSGSKIGRTCGRKARRHSAVLVCDDLGMAPYVLIPRSVISSSATSDRLRRPENALVHCGPPRSRARSAFEALPG